MTDTYTKKKASSAKLTTKEKNAAQMSANRKAALQWYALGGALAASVIVAIVLISIFTEGSIGGHG